MSGGYAQLLRREAALADVERTPGRRFGMRLLCLTQIHE